MPTAKSNGGEISAAELRREQIDRYWAGDMARRVYLFRRQRKAILERCRRIAVVGVSADPDSASYISMEKLLGMGLEMIPVCSDRESLLGLRCYAGLRDIPGKVDIVLIHPAESLDYEELAREAVVKGVDTFWLEPGISPSKEVEDILAAGRVHLVAYESLETEYLKHVPYAGAAVSAARKERKGVKVKEQMSKKPETVRPEDGLKDAIWKMERGHFRHLPVVDENDRLIGMLTDRDVRLIRPSLAFVSPEDAATQLWSISVQQAAVFDPISVKPETPLKEAAELMLRWHVGGLPVVDDQQKLVGIITYTDILREFIGRDDSHH
ncbi:MAG TPA: CBS domain-containing protein [Candidatus Binatia bacterium]|nr:CBS domain-containing protein [Candidatus Binatia bacterium]